MYISSKIEISNLFKEHACSKQATLISLITIIKVIEVIIIITTIIASTAAASKMDYISNTSTASPKVKLQNVGQQPVTQRTFRVLIVEKPALKKKSHI